jgi:hypothetical protein
LAELLVELATSTERALAGTGYDAQDLERIIADLQAPLAFTPLDVSDSPRLDERAPVPMMVCPECGHSWRS